MAVQKIPPDLQEKRSSFQCGRLLPQKTQALEDAYTLERKLGKGAFGELWVCSSKETKKEFACKIFDKSIVKSEDEKRDILKEISILRLFQNQHKSIIQLVEVLESDVALHVIMEMCKGGDLFEILKAKGKLPEPAARQVFKQLAAALDFCHSKGVIHRDIKPENILFQGNVGWLYLMGIATDFQAPVQAKLADFGLSISLKPGETTDGYTGSRFYIAPEMILGKRYGRRADIWSLGVVLCAILTGRLPFSGADRSDDDGLLRAILRGRINFNSPSWAGVSDCAKDLVKKMLQVEPSNRLRASDLMYHPWLTKPKPWSAARLLEDAAPSDSAALRPTHSGTSALFVTPSKEESKHSPVDTVRLRAIATEEFPLGGAQVDVRNAATALLKGTQSKGAPTKPRSEESFRTGGGPARWQRGDGTGRQMHRTSSLLGVLSKQGSRILGVLQGKKAPTQEGQSGEKSLGSSIHLQRVKASLTAEELPEPLMLIGDEAQQPWLPVKPRLPACHTVDGVVASDPGELEQRDGCLGANSTGKTKQAAAGSPRDAKCNSSLGQGATLRAGLYGHFITMGGA